MFVNAKWTAFTQRISNQWPLEAHYNTASHSLIHTHIHALTVVSTTHGESQLVGSSKGEVCCSGTPQHSTRRRTRF